MRRARTGDTPSIIWQVANAEIGLQWRNGVAEAMAGRSNLKGGRSGAALYSDFDLTRKSAHQVSRPTS
eukprot:5183655-Prymnesium_polylepis.1